MGLDLTEASPRASDVALPDIDRVRMQRLLGIALLPLLCVHSTIYQGCSVDVGEALTSLCREGTQICVAHPHWSPQ